MPSTQDTGHAKNVANFSTLITFCSGYGAAYNPSNPALTLASMNALLAAAQGKLTEINTQKAAWSTATNKRSLAFEGLRALCTRIVQSFAACGATDVALETVKSANRKIQGTRAKQKEEGEIIDGKRVDKDGKEIRTNSVSQMGYDNRAENFSRLIALLEAEPLYKPNEAELQLPALKARLQTLLSSKTSSDTYFTNYSNALINRDTVLYHEESGLVTVAADVRKYVRSVFGPSSPQLKQLVSLKFSVVRKGR